MKKITQLATFIFALMMVFSSVPTYAAVTDEDVEFSREEQEHFQSSNARWGLQYHIYKICEEVATELKLTSSQEAWIKETCKAADKTYSGVDMLHSRGRLFEKDPIEGDCNYIAGLNAIFMFARLVGTTGKKQKIMASMPNISSTDKTKVEQLCDTLQTYLENKGSISKEHKQYLIYGFGIHAMSDLFSHRTIVDESTLSEWGKKDTAKDKYFQDEDFKHENINVFKAKVIDGKVSTSFIRTWMASQKSKEEHDYVINYGSGTTQNPGVVYADNPTFMPNRIIAASRASRSFVNQVRREGSSFSNVGFAASTCHVRLQNFDAYKKVTGV